MPANSVILLSSTLILFFILILVFLLFSLIGRKIDWQFKLHKEELLTIDARFRNEIIKVKSDTEEAILTHIGRELHDNVCQSLVLANLYLQVAVNNFDIDMKSKIQQASDTIIHSLNEIKLLAKEFNSDIAMQMGLIESVKDLISRVEETNVLKVGFQVVGEPMHLNSTQELGIFRIIQESISNTVTHALASRANIEINYSDKLLSVVYHDNGKGYNTSLQVKRKLSGMINVQNRANMLNATLKTNTIFNAGSSFFLTIPINQD